jgi:hypothetical protein
MSDTTAAMPKREIPYKLASEDVPDRFLSARYDEVTVLPGFYS